MIYVCSENKDYEEEIRYSIKCLFRIMNMEFCFIEWKDKQLAVLETGDLLLYYGRDCYKLNSISKKVFVIVIKESGLLFGDDFKKKESLPDNPIVKDNFVSLYYDMGGEEDNEYAFEMISYDIIADVFFMISRYEEYVGAELVMRDKYGRFLAIDSVAAIYGFLDRPIVDEWAYFLKEKISKLGYRVYEKTPERNMKLFITHDVDSLCYYKTYKQRIWDWCSGKKGISVLWEKDSNDNICFLAEWEHKHGIKSDYYFIPVHGDWNADYDLCSRKLKRTAERIHQKGHEIGYHAGFNTSACYEEYHSELAQLRSAFNNLEIRGMRSHVLKSKIPDTYREVDKEGIVYDSTLAFPDMEGFRCGTCHPFLIYDMDRRMELDIWEIPLIFMDVTLKEYQHYTPSLMREKFIQYFKIIHKFNGVLTMLWHNNRFGDSDWKEYNKIYLNFILSLRKEFPSMNGYEIVQEYRGY